MPHSYHTKNNGKNIEIIIDEKDQQGSPLDTIQARGEHAKKDPTSAIFEYVKDCAHDKYMAIKGVGYYMAEHPNQTTYGGVGVVTLFAVGIYVARMLKRK